MIVKYLFNRVASLGASLFVASLCVYAVLIKIKMPEDLFFSDKIRKILSDIPEKQKNYI